MGRLAAAEEHRAEFGGSVEGRIVFLEAALSIHINKGGQLSIRNGHCALAVTHIVRETCRLRLKGRCCRWVAIEWQCQPLLLARHLLRLKTVCQFMIESCSGESHRGTLYILNRKCSY